MSKQIPYSEHMLHVHISVCELHYRLKRSVCSACFFVRERQNEEVFKDKIIHFGKTHIFWIVLVPNGSYLEIIYWSNVTCEKYQYINKKYRDPHREVIRVIFCNAMYVSA